MGWILIAMAAYMIHFLLPEEWGRTSLMALVPLAAAISRVAGPHRSLSPPLQDLQESFRSRCSAGGVCVSGSRDPEEGSVPLGPLRGTCFGASGKGEEARDSGLLCGLVRALPRPGQQGVQRS